ncbi:vesicle transport protein GOT1B isoform X2 [Apis cerana]|uniref:vesicle transport protein GOT1B isoform X2 n=1 Tax=Apis cerana TaxID=7461 RepID=UPI0007E2BEAC|nr:vesicle transport protein GOT1B isoform X2 [Apis cerana]
MFEITDTQKIGVGLVGFGISFLFLGVLLLFDKGLLAIGNILFISGLACVIGPKRTLSFFFQKHKIKASASFLGGIIVVLMGWPIIGMIIETYGFVLLFSLMLLMLQWFSPSCDKCFTKSTWFKNYFKFTRYI